MHPPLSCEDHELLFIISCSMSASCFTHWSRRSLIVDTIWSCFSGYLTRSSCKEELKLRSYFEERYLTALSKSNLCTMGPFHSRQINFGPNWRYGRYTVTCINRKPLSRGFDLLVQIYPTHFPRVAKLSCLWDRVFPTWKLAATGVRLRASWELWRRGRTHQILDIYDVVSTAVCCYSSSNIGSKHYRFP